MKNVTYETNDYKYDVDADRSVDDDDDVVVLIR